MKMPKPILWCYERQGRETTTGPTYLTQRLKAVPQGFGEHPLYDKQALIDLLEEAAKECEKEYDNWDNERPLRIAAQAIRKLKETL